MTHIGARANRTTIIEGMIKTAFIYRQTTPLGTTEYVITTIIIFANDRCNSVMYLSPVLALLLFQIALVETSISRPILITMDMLNKTLLKD